MNHARIFTAVPLAQIITERMSDGSLAYNVRVEGGITFGCISERAAIELQHQINQCTAWAQIDIAHAYANRAARKAARATQSRQ